MQILEQKHLLSENVHFLHLLYTDSVHFSLWTEKLLVFQGKMQVHILSLVSLKKKKKALFNIYRSATVFRPTASGGFPYTSEENKTKKPRSHYIDSSEVQTCLLLQIMNVLIGT